MHFLSRRRLNKIHTLYFGSCRSYVYKHKVVQTLQRLIRTNVVNKHGKFYQQTWSLFWEIVTHFHRSMFFWPNLYINFHAYTNSISLHMAPRSCLLAYLLKYAELVCWLRLCCKHSVTRLNCNKRCKGQCFDAGQYECCHDDCTGGCSGPSSTQCWVISLSLFFRVMFCWGLLVCLFVR